MSQSFDHFVIFAEMRTGSNFLESNLNTLDGVESFGEAYNPSFIGYPNQDTLFGMSMSERDQEPIALFEKIKSFDGFGGFRYFHDHEQRVLEPILDDPLCAKIILTRNPLDSYISLKIAQETGQWKLTNVKRRKDAVVAFDGAEFSTHLSQLQGFQLSLLKGLQARGQVPFFISYEDLNDVDVLNGLIKWLGLSHRLDTLDGKMKRQNPAPALSKISNPEEMQESLAAIDTFNLARTPCFEPRRGPNVRSYVAATQSPLLFLPIKGAPEPEIRQWLSDLDGTEMDTLREFEGQKHLRQWMSDHPNHRSFTVLRHPLARAHYAFCDVAVFGQSQFSKKLREQLRRQFQVTVPKPTSADNSAHYDAFSGFLDFLKQNLNGQSPLRVDLRWASQSVTLSGFEDFCAPDMVLREDEIEDDLPFLARKVGVSASPKLSQPSSREGWDLADIYDTELERKAQDVYRRDYMMFGFTAWSQPHK